MGLYRFRAGTGYFSALRMRSTVIFLAGLALTGLLGACSGQKPAAIKSIPRPSANVVKPQPQTGLHGYVAPLPGQWTVGDVLQAYGDYATRKLVPYFAKAKVAYPPRDVALIALKQERKLELWARDSGEFRFIRDYRIQAASGVAGPKLRQGDRQVPEGIYRIAGLNPNSQYHLSMKINYPNEFDLYHAMEEGRDDPGSDIFIHGRAVSIGCLAVGDEAIEELFVLTARTGAENVKVVIAPHDPRVYPLRADSPALPLWTPMLYEIISREINALSPAVKSAKRGFRTLDRRF